MTYKYDVSIIFRALNEEKHFSAALEACRGQILDGLTAEVLLVDSGSTDRTLDIAKEYHCKVVEIPKRMFSFGRSLNWGCEAAKGEYLVFISAHCIPTHDRWLLDLIEPLRSGNAKYSYGRQLGGEVSKFSEKQLFRKYFPSHDRIQDTDFFINNANSAIMQNVWATHKFDEEVTGLEDMVLGKIIIETGGQIAYVANASVIHIHEESYKQVRHRYYREALTLRAVLPEIQMNLFDFIRFASVGIMNDFSVAKQKKVLLKKMAEICAFRIQQFWGSYKGQNENKKISRAQKEAYYYPKLSKAVSRSSSLTRSKSIKQES